MREGIRYAPLGFFFDDILPLAQELEHRAHNAQEQVFTSLSVFAIDGIATDRRSGQNKGGCGLELDGHTAVGAAHIVLYPANGLTPSVR